MAKKFNLTELLNERSKAAEKDGDEEQEITLEGEYTVVDIDELMPSKENFYSTKEIQDLKESIELVGLLQPLLVAELENGKRDIHAGHRRNLALRALVEEGKEQFRHVPVIIKPKKNAILDKLVLIMANRFREKTDWEKMTETIETERLVIELKKQMDIRGTTRDLLAQIIKSSTTQIERYKIIYNKLSPELMAEFKENRIVISVAYEVARLPEDYQRQAAEIFRENGLLTLPDIKNLKKAEEESRQIPGQLEWPEKEEESIEESERAAVVGDEESAEYTEYTEHTECAGAAVEDEEFEPAPETITSLCYSCVHYEKCHEKKSTVTNCKDYINRAEAYKSEEQEEKMNRLPSEGEIKQHEITLPTSKYAEICSGALKFLLLKKDGYKVGEKFDLHEYLDGKETGRKASIKITYVWQDWTGLEDDYCIIGFNVTAITG